MKEIITIQCGSSANYVGTHFWNLLDATCVRLRDFVLLLRDAICFPPLLSLR
jgi:hypothetical protein